jgi:AAA+ ATPase superfamily predicted ATPase
MKFINRTEELGFLERKFSSKGPELIIIYGRRRIGKTELLMRFSEAKPAMYFMGRLESREDTIKRFNNLLIEHFKDSRLLNNPLPNWDTIFTYLAENAVKKTILIIDEFPLLVERFPELLSTLQDKWDSELSRSRILLILSGSSVGMMEKYALDYKSPLYGRRTGQWEVSKMSLPHLREFFPEYSMEDIVRLYSCIDAIPGYLSKFSPEEGIMENIRDRMLSKGEFLYEEVEILLREEFRDPSNYMSIISSVAGGLNTFNELYNKTRLDKSLLSKYLHTLERLGIVRRSVPVTESYKGALRSRGALYSLCDNFFDFWFRFVYLNKQELEKGRAADVLKSSERDFEHYVSGKFESFICEIISLGHLGSFERAGRWWHKENEIDIVALNEREKRILFAECKWKDKVDAEKVLGALKEKAKLVDWKSGKRKESFAVFAKSFSKRAEGALCFDLNDMEKILKKS